MTINIKLPTALYEVKRYEDAEAGTIVECIPVDPILTRFYMGEVTVNIPGQPQQGIRFKLQGTSLREAIEHWEPALRAIIEDMETRAIRSKIIGANGKDVRQ